jgi:hypothetical protein
MRARFHWLTARRSALVQTSPVHAGRCEDPRQVIDHLLARMVHLAGGGGTPPPTGAGP